MDSNEVTEPLVERVESDDIEITHVLLTHHHWDHVVGAQALAERYGVPVVANELTAKELDGVVTEDDHRRRRRRVGRAADRGRSTRPGTAATTPR